MLRDLEVHARELLTVQILGEVPAELRVTPERDRRLAEQARRCRRPDAVRLLDLVGAAIEATADGAQPRIQLELVLIKAAAPQIDPSATALLARIERLESGATAGRTGLPAAGAGARRPADGGRRRAPLPARPRPDRPGAGRALPSAPTPSAPGARRPPAAPPRRLSPDFPATRPAAPTAPPARRPGPREIVAAWPAVVDIVRGDNVMIGALLEGARPVR